ncbi:protein hinderin isoform 2-T2 [Polymixia lowei]
MVFIPGVNREVKFQTPFKSGPGSTSSASDKGTKMRTKHGCEPAFRSGKKRAQLQSSSVYTKGKGVLYPNIAVAMEHTPSPANSDFLPMSQKFIENSTTKSQACLKDLCPEDKRRIANLIEELARVSEEKEESVQRLRNEQETFERKIQQMEQQNLLIVQERESLQQQYRECQELLGLYQQYLSQQQEKLNQSIAQLSHPPAHSKVSSSEGVCSRPSTSRAYSSALDGSYLGLATAPTGHPQVHRRPGRGGGGGGGAAKAFSNPDSPSTMTPPRSSSSESERTPAQGPVKRHGNHQGGQSLSHSKSQHRREHHIDDGYRTQPQRTGNDPRLESGRRDGPNQHGHDRLPSGEAMGPGADGALTAPRLGHEDWEEKRHQLLLQKMQLEVERERLQARLAEQEEQLLRQNQQLRQSRLDYSRFQHATQAELGSSNARNGAAQPEGPPHRHSLSSERVEAEVDPVERVQSKELPQTSPDPLQNGVRTHEALQCSRRDMATSPVMAPVSQSKPTSVPEIPRTPQTRLDSSLVELLEVFSPISVPEQSRPSAQRHKLPRRVCGQALSGPQPAHRALLSPARPYPQSPQQDLEESQILEEIFFIC